MSTLAVLDPEAPLTEQAKVMDQACRSLGFFRLPFSCIDRGVAERAWEAAAAFFALPDEAKLAVGFPEPGYPYGYSPFGFESLAKSTDDGTPAGRDLKESFSVGPDCAAEPGTALVEEGWIRSPSLWPERPAELRAAWTEYYRAQARLAEHLMRVTATAFDLPVDYFDSYIDRAITSMRALHYPQLATPSPQPLRAGAHSDYGTLTILRTDNVAGLQIQALDGSWHDVAPEPETFVVNMGDSIAQWTNDQWRSTMHRVTAIDPAPRQSLAFFHMANWDATIECLPTCLEPGEEPRHEPAQAGPWLMRKFQSTVL